MNQENETSKESLHQSSDEQDKDVSIARRAAVTKLAYASPVIAGILFSQRAAGQGLGSPPPAPRPTP